MHEVVLYSKILPRTFLSTLRRSSTITASTRTKNTQFSIVMTLAFRFGWNELKILLKAKSRNSRTVIRLIPRKKPNVPPKFPKGKKWQITVGISVFAYEMLKSLKFSNNSIHLPSRKEKEYCFLRRSINHLWYVTTISPNKGLEYILGPTQ